MALHPNLEAERGMDVDLGVYGAHVEAQLQIFQRLGADLGSSLGVEKFPEGLPGLQGFYLKLKP